MGTLGTLFSTIANRAEQHAQIQRQQAEEARASQRQIYGNVLSNPNATEDQRSYAIDQLNKLNGVGKKGDSPYDKLGGFLNTLGRKMQGLPSLDGQQSQQQPMSSVAGGPAASDVNQPGIASRIVGKGLTALSSGLSNVTQAHNLPPMAGPMQADMIPAMGMGASVKVGTKVTPGEALAGQLDIFNNPISAEDAKGKFYLQHEYKNGQVRWQPINPTANLSGRAMPIHPISITNAKQLADLGQKFTDAETGNDIDVSQLDPSMQIVPMTFPGGRIAYKVTSQNQTHFNVGNTVYAVPGMEQMNTAQVGVPLGVAKVPTTRTQPGQNPVTGEFGNYTTTVTPSTSGVTGGLPPLNGARAPMSSTQQSSPASIPKPGKPAGTATPKPLTPLSPTSTGGTVVPFGAAGRVQQQMIPVREAATAVFGDPETGLHGLQDFAAIADNKASRERVGMAVKATLDQAGNEEKTNGGFVQAIENAGGVTGFMTQAKNNVVTDMLSRMTPAERANYNAIIAAYSGIIGARSLTKASAAQFSVQALERDIPIPGVNTISKQDYYDKLARIGEMVYNGSRMIPFSPQEKQHMKSQLQELVKRSHGEEPGGKSDAVQVKLKDGRTGSIHRTQLQRFLTDNPGSSEVK